jgi:hypothetical protein
MPTQQQFAQAQTLVIISVRRHLQIPMSEITGDMNFGPETWSIGKPTNVGLGLGRRHRENLRLDLNAWLRNRPHNRLLLEEEVGAGITVNQLINYIAHALM